MTFGRRLRRAWPLALLLVVLLAGVALRPLTQDEGDYHVEGRQLLDPDGEPFVIRGVVLPYGTFAGGDGGGLAAVNERQVSDDVRRVKEAGANLIRVFIMPGETQPDLSDVDRVADAAQREGLVTQLSGAFNHFEGARPLVERLARHFAGRSDVWIQPMNEPQCANDIEFEAGDCDDWELWKRQHTEYVRIIRDAGVTSPIVVNVPNYSFDLAPLSRYRLADQNVLYGAHRYGNAHATFDEEEQQSVERSIAAPSRQVPVFVDELGNWNGDQFPNRLEWSAGMARWIQDWVRRGEGLGATGFNWRWSDPNTMIDSEGRLTPWGQTFSETILSGLRPAS